MIRFKCERCGAVIRCPDTIVGKHVTCPTCQHKLIVPRKTAPVHRRFLLIGGLAVVVLAVVWVVWALIGPGETSRTDADSSSGTSVRPEPGTQEALREIERLRQDELTRALEAETARRIQQEIDHAKWLADRDARQRREEAERKEAEERSRLGLPPKEALNP